MTRTVVALDAAPSLLPLMLRGAVLSPFKRPRQDAPLPDTRLTVPGLRITQNHLTAYERACGFATERHELPVTYPHVLGFPLAMRLMSERAFPLPVLGLVHTSISITQQRDLSPAETYELGVHVHELQPHRRGTEAVVVTELHAEGAPVWQSTSTYLARHKTSAPTAEQPQQDSPAQPLPELARWRLGEDLGRRYAAASGDRNPIHLHPLTARLFGFPRAIAHGMWTVARCLAEHKAHGPVHVQARFKAPVLLPGEVVYGAQGPAFELRSADGSRTHVTGEVHGLAD
ncbi:MaoC family dehydratase [Streptomyces endophyticus]|uniref:MaoC/PaaZ C-terminal domain-containing protein n=1 Tax=Streptomyces endophyticus TaxID=714166 RepID=A0ABU6FCJ4_9ACTN|nr:MaoC/PaaZ C-terminal domain-containing protein [Streptomyces endophyticus]MEB8341699.1 MaoC/PaaZ C-terminal domain-containing protein [Streptomyces endophyticus]